MDVSACAKAEVDFVLKEGLEVEQLIQVVSAEIEVKAVVGANGSSELEGSKRNRRVGNIKKHFQQQYGYEGLWLCYCR